MTDPVADNQQVHILSFATLVSLMCSNSADANIKTNLTQLQVLGQEWGSDIILDAFNNLSLNTTTANSGNLVGNRVFYANDYAVSSRACLEIRTPMTDG